MNTTSIAQDIETIYNILKKNYNSYLFSNILGEDLTDALTLYHNEFISKDHGIDFDYARILVDALSESILDNRKIQQYILNNLSNSLLKVIIPKYNETNKLILIKEYLSKNTIKRVKSDLIRVLNLNIENFNLNVEINTNPNNEIIKPFTPLKSDSIHKEIFLSLHDYQKNIKNQIIQNLLNNDPSKRKFLVHMPTGAGKTKTTIEALVDYIRIKSAVYDNEHKIIFWLAHTKELCQQGYDTLKDTWQFKGDYDINLVKFFDDAKFEDLNTCKVNSTTVVFGGFAKLISFFKSKNDDYISLKRFLIQNSILTIVDEAHKTLATTYQQLIDTLTENSYTKLIGLTATPGRGISNIIENEILTDYYNGNLITLTKSDRSQVSKPLEYLQNKHYLAQIDLTTINIDSEIKITDNDDEISKLLSTNPFRNKFIIDFIIESYYENDSILVFANSINHCVILKALLKMVAEIDAEFITGNTNKTVRENFINDFKSKKLKVLINYGVLSTGFDAPKLNTLVISRPTSSIILYSQMVGRALRGELNGGNPHHIKNKILTVKDTLKGYDNPSQLFNYFDDFWK